MRFTRTLLFAATILASTAMPAFAQQGQDNGLLPPGWGDLSANIGVVSDYRFRGFSYTDEKPALQGSLDWTHDSGVYLGTWASNVDFPDADVEVDLYGGYAFDYGAYNIDVGAIGYYFPGAADSRDYDYYEGKLAVSRSMGKINTTGALNYSPDYIGGSGDALYASFGADAPIMDTGFTVQGSAGYQWIDDETAFGAPDYADWSVGVSYDLYGFDLGLKYTDTNVSDRRCNDVCDATAIFSVSRSFN